MYFFYLIVYEKNRLHIEHLSGVGRYQKAPGNGSSNLIYM